MSALGRLGRRCKAGMMRQRNKAVRGEDEEEIMRQAGYHPYSKEAHGPVYCLNSLGVELIKTFHPSRDHTDPGVLKTYRNLFCQLLWSNLKIPGGWRLEDIPIYHGYQQGRCKGVGIGHAFLPSWLNMYRDNLRCKEEVECKNHKLEVSFKNPHPGGKEKSFECTEKPPVGVIAQTMADLLPESTSKWTHVKRVTHLQWDTLKTQFRVVDRLTAFRRHFEETVADYNRLDSPIKRLVSLDIEAYENAQRKLTEFGISVYERRCGTLENFHIIIKEHLNLRNKDFARDAKHAFAFGKSMYMSTSEAMECLADQLKEPGTALVGHSLQSDINFLKRAKVNKRRISLGLLDAVPQFDLQHLYRCSRASDQHSKLEVIAARLGLDEVAMHNAGNDAALTLSAFIKLMTTVDTKSALSVNTNMDQSVDTSIDQTGDTSMDQTGDKDDRKIIDPSLGQSMTL